MRIFKTAWFVRFARRAHIQDAHLTDAVRRLCHGQVDADLGGGIVKQRLTREGQGRSRGYRAIIVYRRDQTACFVYGYSKSNRASLRADETRQFKLLAARIASLSVGQLDALVSNGQFEEVAYHDEAVQE